ncbi:MAG: F-type H+-transporting ATPase subunit a [Frankiaceae bacterium]|nr:F-type H+-transporting ATPase subunit a [Frankiaceae bacterium]
MSLLLAAESHPGFQDEYPIGPSSFEFKSLSDFTLFGLHVAVTRLVTMAFFATIVLCLFFLIALRKPKLVPGRTQFIAESIYGFVRDKIARDVMGPDGLRFASYLTCLFVFIFVLNLYEILPLAQAPVTGRIAYPAVLAIITWVLFITVGIKKQGLGTYFKGALFPPGVPKFLYILLTPIEFVSTFIFRPFTLAVRLFANMFAGHLLLAVFATGTVYLLTVGNFSVIFFPVSFLMTLVMTFFELLVQVLQAYVFVVLTATYVSGAMEEH